MSVYFAQVGPYIKIGYSTNPERRVRRLFASATRYSAPDGTPFNLHSRRLIRYIDGTTNTEAPIHQALEDFRVGQEWFVDEPEVRDFIATVEHATEYESVTRPDGPVEPVRDALTPEDQAQLMAALDVMSARMSRHVGHLLT